MPVLKGPDGPSPRDLDLTRRAAGGLLLAGYALGAGPLRAEPVHTDASGLVARMVQLPARDGFRLPAYLAMPEDARRAPVIVVVCEVFGLHEYIRDVCRRLAQNGYVAIAPDLFARAGDPSRLTDFDEIRKIVSTAGNAQVMGDISATLDWLATQPDVGQPHRQKFADMKRVGITGFCWGGGAVWMAVAADPRFRAGVAWYGRLARPKPGEMGASEAREWPIDVAGRLHGPVLGLYAGRDQGITQDSIEQMRAALMGAGDHQSRIVVYPEANHGFHADYRASTYDPSAAEDGWRRLLEWFDLYVKRG